MIQLFGPFAELGRSEAAGLNAVGLFEGFFATLYDATTFEQTSDIADYLELAAGGRGRILEAACGSGRVLLRLAEAGHDVVGFDRSPAMLAKLGARVNTLSTEVRKHIEVVNADVVDFEFNEAFRLILLPGLSLGALLEINVRRAFFTRVAAHLAESGRFAFDFLCFPPAAMQALDQHILCQTIPTESGSLEIACGTRFVDGGRRYLVNFHSILASDGAEARRDLGAAEFVHIDTVDLAAQLQEAGLEIIHRTAEQTPVMEVPATRWRYVCERRRPCSYPLWHPHLPMNEIEENALVLVDGQGSRVRDVHGREFVDASGGLWNTHCGLGRTEIVDAISGQLARLSYGTLFALRSHSPAIELSKALLAIGPPGLSRVLLTCSGSEAVEASVKLARAFFHLRGEDERNEIVYLDRSYHGTYYASMGLSGLHGDRDRVGPHVPGFHAIRAPGADRDGRECAQELVTLIEQRPSSIAALILEPVLGSAGVIVPPAPWFSAVQKACRDHGVLLISDEIATAFGRTGRWFAGAHFDLRPDIMLVSKGLTSGYIPLGAVLFSEEIARTFIDRSAGLPHGSTAGGTPAACAAALATISVIRSDGLVERAAMLGDRMAERLDELRGCPWFFEHRGLGLMRAIELRSPGPPREPLSPLQVGALYLHLQRKGVLAYPAPSGLSFFPALTTPIEDIDFIVDRLGETLRELFGEGASELRDALAFD